MEAGGFPWPGGRSSVFNVSPREWECGAFPFAWAWSRKPQDRGCNGDSRHLCRHAADPVLRGLSPVSPLSPNQPSLHLGSYFRLPAASGEHSPYRHDIAVPDVINGSCRQTARCCFLDMFTPPRHHRSPAFDVVRSVVSASDFVLVDMRQRDFD